MSTKKKQPQVAAEKATQEIKELKLQLQKMSDARLQAMADLQNYRRRMDEERTKFGLMTNMQLVQQILEIVDDITLGLADDTMSVDRAKELLKILQTKLLAALNIAGVEQVTINTGDKFDQTTMEAVSTAQVSEKEMDGQILAIISGAFRYRGQTELLKHGKVIVGKFAGSNS